MAYGDKRDFPKIDVARRGGGYVGSTTWAKTCREACERFAAAHGGTAGDYVARFDKRGAR